ncbi:MAG TPA: PIN domain-containing protein [Candidatus Limnocylindrales bacterium]
MTSVRILADSAFVIDYLRGEQEAEARWEAVFADGDEPVVNEIVVCEVSTGLKPWELQDLDAFLEPVELIQPGPDAALLAGRWRSAARADGWTLGLADALIAAAAYTDNAAVLTRNTRDFALTPVRLVTY